MCMNTFVVWLIIESNEVKWVFISLGKIDTVFSDCYVILGYHLPIAILHSIVN